MSAEEHRKECIRRHYENMDKLKANKVLDELKTKAEKQRFIKRINHAKGYEFIRG